MPPADRDRRQEDREDTGIGTGSWAEYRRLVVSTLESNTNDIKSIMGQAAVLQKSVDSIDAALKNILGSSGRPGVISQIERKITYIDEQCIDPLGARVQSLERSRVWVKGAAWALGIAWTALLGWLAIHRG